MWNFSANAVKHRTRLDSHNQTLTVGSGISPDLLIPPCSGGARGLRLPLLLQVKDYRRWGLSPRPEINRKLRCQHYIRQINTSL